MQFVESIENKSQKDAFVAHFDLKINVDKGMYDNISNFDTKHIADRLKTWNKYAKMSSADKIEIKKLLKSKSAKISDLYNAFYRKVNRENEESVPPSPKS